MIRDEDAKQTLLFVDMLGFSALTEKFKTRVIDSPPDEYGFEGSGTSPIQNNINVFHRIIDVAVSEQTLYSEVHAMLFSDCAFIDAGNSPVAALLATAIMRKCILEHVPVRIGLGRGTFYVLTFSTEINKSTMISRSRFVGTAIVYAHAAESCKAKGMRIFVHPSVEEDLALVQQCNVRVLPLKNSLPGAKWELDFLHGHRPVQQQPSADEDDLNLFEAVGQMKDPSAPMRVRRHYTETFSAMNRMRKANSRKTVSPRAKRYSTFIDRHAF